MGRGMPGERCRITRLKRRPSESFAFAFRAGEALGHPLTTSSLTVSDEGTRSSS